MARPYRAKKTGRAGKYIIPYKDERGHWRNKTGTGNYQESRRMQADLLRRIEAEKNDALKKEIGQAFDLYLREQRRKNLRWTTYVRLEIDLDLWLRTGGENGGAVRRWEQARPETLNAWLDLAQAGKLPGQRQPWGATTANAAIVRIRAFCAWAVERGLIDRNPLDAMRPRRGDKRKIRRALSRMECRMLLRTCHDPDERELFACLLMTGLRCQEAFSLTWADLDLQTDQPSIRIRAEISKTRKARMAPMLPELREILQARKKQTAASRDPRVFGRWLDRYPRSSDPDQKYEGGNRRLLRALRRIGKKLGWARLQEIDIHSLRVTFVTLADAAGLSANAIRLAVGHTGFSQLSAYLKSAPEATAAQFGKIGSFFGGENKPNVVTSETESS